MVVSVIGCLLLLAGLWGSVISLRRES